MNVSIVTAFPELFSNFLAASIPGRAVLNGLVGVKLINLREFGHGNYRQLDDYAFGSGGMLFAAPQLKDALISAITDGIKPFVVYPSPQGTLISQEIIETLSHQEHVIIICGHYEGIDERFTEKYIDLEVSIGDCVLTGGEVPAMLIVDAMSRLVPGVVGKSKAVIEDSFYRGLLDNPNYTRPHSWEGVEVPEVLLSGNEREISHWRRREAVTRTITRRPDLISRASIREYISGSVNIAVIAHDQGLNISGIPELCRAYDLGRPYVVAHNHELRESIRALCPEAKILGSIRKVLEHIKTDDVLAVKVYSGAGVNSLHSLEIKRRCLEHDGSILLVFSQDEDELDMIEGISGYIYEHEANIPMNLMISVSLDRLLGKR